MFLTWMSHTHTIILPTHTHEHTLDALPFIYYGNEQQTSQVTEQKVTLSTTNVTTTQKP